MTKEEAIEILKDELYSGSAGCDEEISQALDTAIKALEQEPCEDCISRADVEQTVEDNILCYTHSDRPIDQDPDTDCHKAIRIALKMLRKDLRKLPPVTPRSLNPEADREESKAYCAECDHIEMCSWYPHDGCEWLKIDRYNAGYNAAKREIALSGEYERAYERGKADAHPKMGRWIAYEVRLPDRTILNYRCSVCGRKLIGYNTETLSEAPFCHCGAKMVEPQESENVVVTHKNLCDSCTTKGCIFQSGIVRNHCDFYKAESECKA